MALRNYWVKSQGYGQLWGGTGLSASDQSLRVWELTGEAATELYESMRNLGLEVPRWLEDFVAYGDSMERLKDLLGESADEFIAWTAQIGIAEDGLSAFLQIAGEFAVEMGYVKDATELTGDAMEEAGKELIKLALAARGSGWQPG